MPRAPSVPSYRLHRPSGQAVVTVRALDGSRKDIYLGAFNSPASRSEYARIVAESASGPVVNASPAARLTVDEMLLAFFKFAERHYRKPDGSPATRLACLKYSAMPLHTLYGGTLAASFGPVALRAVRQMYVDGGNCRTTVNKRVEAVRTIFKWAVSHELVPATVHTALVTVRGLEAGRTTARETEHIGPVTPAAVEAVLPELNPQVRGLVGFQRLTGCRPSEACGLRLCDIDRTGDVWLYTPAQHKTQHRGKHRVIAIGPKCQDLLAPFIALTNADGYVFSPRRVKGASAPARFTYNSYAHQLRRACLRAGVAPWAPNRLRHAFATMVRREHGLEAAQVLLGHSRADTTQLYAQRDTALGASVASKVG